MYQPLAAAVIAAMAAALVLALTAGAGRGGARSAPARRRRDDDVALLRRVKRWYAPVLDRCLRHPRRGGVGDPRWSRCPAHRRLRSAIGSDFMPQLDEGAFLLQTVLPAEASLEEVDRLNHRVEDVLREVPEVDDVVRRTGRAERTEDPMPHTRLGRAGRR